MLTRMLVAIGVPEDLASEDACRIEHVISDETLEAVKRFLEKG
jgi:Mn-dependent DtxR family transcriptional regulator